MFGQEVILPTAYTKHLNWYPYKPPNIQALVFQKVSAMQQSDEFSSYHDELLDGRYDCVDRIVLNGYFSLGQQGGGFRTWWRQLTGSMTP